MTYTVPTGGVWMDLDISGQTACVLNASNEVSCWNVANPTVDAISPEVSNFDWTSISYGGTQICGLDEIGNVDCWNAINFTPASEVILTSCWDGLHSLWAEAFSLVFAMAKCSVGNIQTIWIKSCLKVSAYQIMRFMW